LLNEVYVGLLGEIFAEGLLQSINGEGLKLAGLVIAGNEAFAIGGSVNDMVKDGHRIVEELLIACEFAEILHFSHFENLFRDKFEIEFFERVFRHCWNSGKRGRVIAVKY